MKSICTIILLLMFAVSMPAQVETATAKGRPVDFTQVLHTLTGSVMVDSDSKTGVPVTLGSVAVNALLGTIDEDRTITGTEKLRRYEIAKKVSGQSSVMLTVEELATIKERIGKVYGPLIVGAAWHALDPAQ